MIALALLVVSAAPRLYAEALRARAAAAPMARIVPPPAPPGWTKAETGEPAWRPEFQGADGEFLQAYGRAGRAVHVYVAYYSWQRWRAKLISGQNRFADEKTWRLAERSEGTILHDRRPVAVGIHRLIFDKGERVVHYVYWADGKFTADPLTVKLLQAKAFLLAAPQHSAVIALAADVEPGGASPREIVNDFLSGFSSLSQLFGGGLNGSDHSPRK